MGKVYLVLENGTVFEGQVTGAVGEATGELVLATGVVGYMETLTDPRNTGKILVQTFPLIGNYGVIAEDLCGTCRLGGYVVRELCTEPSNFRSGGTVGDYLARQGVPGICGVDTRAITRILRDHGPMTARICGSIPEDLQIQKTVGGGANA